MRGGKQAKQAAEAFFYSIFHFSFPLFPPPPTKKKSKQIMFGTFRYNQETNDHEHVEILRADGQEARGYTRMACKSCRARKVSSVIF